MGNGSPALLLENIPLPRPIAPEDQDRARKTVCAYANDVEEARTLLSMLGLLETT